MSKTPRACVADFKDWSDWYRPIMKEFRFGCCECGLCHDIDFKIKKGRVWIRLRRNNRSTGQLRRHMK